MSGSIIMEKTTVTVPESALVLKRESSIWQTNMIAEDSAMCSISNAFHPIWIKTMSTDLSTGWMILQATILENAICKSFVKLWECVFFATLLFL